MIRRRTAAELHVTEPLDWTWPVTYRFSLSLPWGETQQLLSIDAPGVAGDVESTLRLGSVLWSRAVAPATVLATKLEMVEAVAWRFEPAPLPMVDGLTRGLLAGTPAPRADSAVAVLDTGYLDDIGVSRVAVPGIPASWVSDGLLSLPGLDALETWGAMLLMGLCRQLVGSPLQWLVHYPGLLEPSTGNPTGVAFRKVEYVYGMHHTRPAPEPGSAWWY